MSSAPISQKSKLATSGTWAQHLAVYVRELDSISRWRACRLEAKATGIYDDCSAPDCSRGIFSRAHLGAGVGRSPRVVQSPVIFACLKYFMPTHAVTTQTQAMIQVKIIKDG